MRAAFLYSPFLLVLGTVLVPGTCLAADKAYTFVDARSFLREYCAGCHNAQEPEADLNLQRYETAEQLLADRKLWDEVLLRVRKGEMPPRNKRSKMPPEDARQAFLRWTEQKLRQAACEGEPKPGPAPIRRLNKDQYRCTIRDLLGIHYDAAHALPDDGAGGEGFDNAAETLFLSPVHAEKYLEAARQAIDYAAKDSAARKLIFVALPDDKTAPEEAARPILRHFATRAYRRPARDAEVERLLALFRKESARGQPFDESILYALQAVLVSPHFLFRVEETAPGQQAKLVTDYELATRLSYFLWNSMPDEELSQQAAAGKLHDETVLKNQMVRMLKDRRGRGLAQSFAGQWLGTRRLGTEIVPDRKVFPQYTAELENAMREEPLMFLQEILTENRSLLDLLDADFTYADPALAKFYGIGPVRGFGQLVRAPLPKDRHRGGVLTMAGVLTVSSYPQRTSPVLRGKWVLEAILGTPPPPPPPNVPELSEDRNQIAGKTLRERLLLHRQNATCASCHDWIDPIGFGLENFDAIGRWRDQEAGQPIDATASLPDGTKFEGPEGLKKALLAQKDDFVRHFTAKILGYALGRGLVPEDSCVVDRAVKALKQNDYYSHVLVWEIIRSMPFRHRPGLVPKETAP